MYQPTAEYGSSISLTAGQAVPITVEYFEHGGEAAVTLYAKAPTASPPVAQTIVPASWLTTDPAPLPVGWSLSAPSGPLGYTGARVEQSSVTLLDSTGATHLYGWNGSGWTPPVGEYSVLFTAANGELKLQAEDGYTYVFDAAGQIASVTSAVDDRHPAAVQYTWGSSIGQLHRITDPVSGRKFHLQYGGNTNTDPAAPACPTTPPTGLDPAPQGGLYAVTYWDGTSTVLWYKSGQLARIVDPGSEVTDFGYNAAGLLSQIRDPLAADALAAAGSVPALSWVTPHQLADRGHLQRHDRQGHRRHAADPGSRPAGPGSHLPVRVGDRDPDGRRRVDATARLRPQGHLRRRLPHPDLHRRHQSHHQLRVEPQGPAALHHRTDRSPVDHHV